MKTLRSLTPWALSTAAMLLLQSAAGPAYAAKPGEICPEFEDRRAKLGPVTVLADVVVTRQEGGTPVLKRSRSQAYTDSLLLQVETMLASKGLDVQRTQLVSIFGPSSRAMHSSSFVGLTMVSGSDGMIVWDDWVARQSSLKLESLRTDIAAMAKNMP